MIPDDQCTLFFDGVPTWLGGSGREWLGCCILHDHSTLPWHAADLELARCVAGHGFPAVAGIMLIGLSTLGLIYRAWLRRR